MMYVSEQVIQSLVKQSSINDAVESMYANLSNGEAQNFPTVRESIEAIQGIFGVKSGVDFSGSLLGLKAGGYWKNNVKRMPEITNHQSTVLLFDVDTGETTALVQANYLTALRTAAASALSIRYLSKKDARILGIVGAGGQAEFQVRAAIAERQFETVLVAARSLDSAKRLVDNLQDLKQTVIALPVEELVSQADTIITMTSSNQPIFKAQWVGKGTHIACMGTDTRGKQELDIRLLESAELFVDDKAQATTIGEFQHAWNSGQVKMEQLTSLGDVINGTARGRNNDEEITIFDSSGVGLQDLVSARVALELASHSNLATKLV